jgi:calpain-15
MARAEGAELSLCTKICRGEAGLLIGCLTWPFVLLYNAIDLYFFACLSVLAGRLYRFLCFPLLQLCCCYTYKDKRWSGQRCLGEHSEAWQEADTEWIRVGDLKDGHVKLFESKIEPRDLTQGAVGDCWLVAALASAAEHPACIRNAFLTPEANPRGKYRIRLFDDRTMAWKVITIDDLIPCDKESREPHFMQMNGNESWAVLMEKAFAKMWGSYQALDGGSMNRAWIALTGDHAFCLHKKRPGLWERSDEKYTNDNTWMILRRYTAAKSLVNAAANEMADGNARGGSGLNGEDVSDALGLVVGHAYSILDVRELGLIPGLNLGAGLLGRTKLIQLRNPWGVFEWKGAWSDGSKEWQDNPLVKARLRPKDEDDGSFWMPWDDFCRLFDEIAPGTAEGVSWLSGAAASTGPKSRERSRHRHL